MYIEYVYKLLAPVVFNRRCGGSGGEVLVPLELFITSLKEGQNHGF